MKFKSFKINLITTRAVLFLVFVLFVQLELNAQVKASIDSTSIKIGSQATYKIDVETDSTDLVVFPEGQSFQPMEMVEASEIDTIRKRDKFNLIRKYALTQFDSGYFRIPSQKVLIGDRTFNTDSMSIAVNMIEVDTTKQGLYDIKPIIEVEKSHSDFWKYLIIALLVLALVAGLLYWFVWRKKPLTEEERVALLPPYDRAKLALRKLDEHRYLERSELKAYYSELTLAIRKYLDEKVYDHSLESTTEELVFRLNLLREGNQIDLSEKTINNLESILKRADLVKFAKSAPDIELAKMDRNTIDTEIDHVKESLPEPTEEEKLLNEEYRKRQAKRKRDWKLLVTGAVLVVLINITFVGFGIKYGFGYVIDKIFGDDTLELLEGEWVDSAYGIPPVYISTPEVLERAEVKEINEDESTAKTIFRYGKLQEPIFIRITTTRVRPEPKKEGEDQVKGPDIRKYTEANLVYLENNGVKNIITKTDLFKTPNAQEGVKVFGTARMPINDSGDTVDGSYTILGFTAESVVQEIIVTWHSDDDYTKDIVDRIMESIELKKQEEDDAGN